MATNRDLLKEAIADAKAVKETAIANAKAALEEAFTPQLKTMFAAKLQEMEEMDEMEDKDMYEMEDKESMKEGEDETMNEIDLEELLAELEEEEGMEESLNEAEEEEEDMEMSDEESEEGEEEGEPLDLEDMTDEDLKSMIEDVIKDMIEAGELEAGHEGEGEEEAEETGIEDEEEVDLAELLREIEEMEEMEEPIDELFGLKTRSVLSYLTDVKKMDKAAAKQAMKDLEEKNISPISADEVNDLRAYLVKDFDRNRVGSMVNPILAAISGGKAVERPLGGAAASQSATIGEMKAELAEAMSTIEALKSELNEINLLNAKLLYTNKIFKSKNLNENQKVKVLSSFDKAKTVGEVKMVFETLNEGIKVNKNTIKENLGSASKATLTPNAKKPIVESNDAFLRMQKLAGII
jgi:S-DNA-T family DNA segregation ATPase FtsK/SpoIIIE